MAVLCKLQMQFYTEEPADFLWTLQLFLSFGFFCYCLFVCCTKCGSFLLYSQIFFFFFPCPFFLHLFEKRLYFILFATAKTKMKFYELRHWHEPSIGFYTGFWLHFGLSLSTFLFLPSEHWWCIWDGTSAMLHSTKLLWKSASTIIMKINRTFHVGKTIWLIHLLPVITFQCTLTKLVEVLLRWVGLSVWWRQAIPS